MSMNWMDWVAVDPEYSIAWWQISAESIVSARERLDRFGGPFNMVLRVTQRAPSGVRTTNIPVESISGERLVMLGEPGATHHAAIGIETAGFFTAIVRAPALVSPQNAGAT
jgi:hypothetical protein